MPFGFRFPKIAFAPALALLVVIVLLTRIPFLGAGYGLHADNWRVALAARHIAETGAYEASRFPGYPIQEYVCSWFWRTGPLGLNALDAFFCLAAVAWFACICREYGCRDWWLASLALAFVPVVYVNSVSSKDFLWALAFLLGAWWCAMRKYPLRTGILLGAAMGCRITSGAAALPIALILVEGLPNAAALRSVLLAGLSAAAVALCAFAPAYWRYGFDFFSFYADHTFPTSLMIVKRATVEVWGWLGAAGVAIALLAAVFHPPASRPPVSRRHLLAWVLMLVIYLFAFLSLPDEAAYLIPIVPILLLIAWHTAPPLFFRMACLLILLSPWIGWSDGHPVAGDIVQDHRDRVSTVSNIKGFLAFSAMVSGSNAYIVGSWAPPIAVLTAEQPTARAKFLYLVSRPELDELKAQGWRVWYLPLMREFDARVYHFDIARDGARSVLRLQPDLPPR